MTSRTVAKNISAKNEAAPLLFHHQEETNALDRSTNDLSYSSSNLVKYSYCNSNIKNTINSGTPVIQPKLEINQPGDKYEQEADAMSDKVMRMQESSESEVSSGADIIQRKCAHCEEEEKEEDGAAQKKFRRRNSCR